MNIKTDRMIIRDFTMNDKITGVTKEVRPVFSEELRFLGLDRDYGWDFPDCEGPLMWAEARRYFYKGELVCEASGGGLYEMPTLKNVIKDLRITPVDIEISDVGHTLFHRRRTV